MSSAAVIAGMTATVVATIALAGVQLAGRPHDRRLLRRRPLGAGLVERLGDLRGVPVGRVVPGRGRADHGRRCGRRLVPGGLRRGLRAAAGPGRRAPAPLRAPTPCPTSARPGCDPRRVRLAASVLVVVIGWLYVVPQLQGAGRALQIILGTPLWLGGVLVALTVLVVIVGGRHAQRHDGPGLPVLAQAGRDHGAGAVPAGRVAARRRPLGAGRPGAHVPRRHDGVGGHGHRDHRGRAGDRRGRRDDRRDPRDGRGGAGRRDAHASTRARPSPSPPARPSRTWRRTPATTGTAWGQPLQGGQSHPMYRTYALMIALFLGTMGLPHVLVRFYTNPDGRQARRTALIVIGLVGLFYLSPSVFGMLGRVYTPELLMTGQTDAVVLLLPAGAGRRRPRAGAHRPGLRRGGRGLPGDRHRPDRHGRRGAVPGRREPLGARPDPVVPGRRGRGRPRPAGAEPRWPAPCPWPRRSRSPSRWPPPRSARCCCWASGGPG